jgi:hypothetical protein
MKHFDKMMQVILFVATGIFTVIGFLYGFMAGMFLVGCWQLLSALVTSIERYIQTREIPAVYKRYWVYVIADFLVMAVLFLLNAGWLLHLTWVLGAISIAAYYFIITMYAERKVRWHNTFIR